MAAPRRDLRDQQARIDRLRLALGTQSVRITGEIGFSNERPIRQAIERAARAGSVSLDIASRGGLIEVANRIARDVEQTGANAFVSAECSSAAVDILTAARTRVATPQSCFVLHRRHVRPEDLAGQENNAESLARLAVRFARDDEAYFKSMIQRYRLGPDALTAMRGDGLVLDGVNAFAAGLVHWIDTANPFIRRPPTGVRR